MPQVELLNRLVVDTTIAAAAETSQKQVLVPKVGTLFGQRATSVGG